MRLINCSQCSVAFVGFSEYYGTHCHCSTVSFVLPCLQLVSLLACLAPLCLSLSVLASDGEQSIFNNLRNLTLQSSHSAFVVNLSSEDVLLPYLGLSYRIDNSNLEPVEVVLWKTTKKEPSS